MSASRFALIAFGLLIATVPPASACSCGGIHGRTAWEIAEKAAQGSQVIFEGRLVRSAVEWDVLNAKDGEMIRLRPGMSSEGFHPRMVITLRVKRLYKGDNVGPEVQVRTGLGGGDCGSEFLPGLDYLIYTQAATASSPVLWVSRCGPSAWIGNSSVAIQLRYLRKQAQLKSDLAPLKPWWTASAGPSEWQEIAKRYAAATGQICGVVSTSGDTGSNRGGEVRFLPTSGYSPYGPSAEVNQEGKFCSDRLGPGEYYLHFTRLSREKGTSSAAYYPGVAEREKAAIVRVSAGQVQSNLRIQAPKPRAYTIHGFLSTDEKLRAEQNSNATRVYLLGLDSRIWDTQEIDLQNPLPLPKVKYFAFENVVPGRYIAFASPLSIHGYTKIVHVNVTNHGKLIFLALKNKN